MIFYNICVEIDTDDDITLPAVHVIIGGRADPTHTKNRNLSIARIDGLVIRMPHF